MSMDENPPGFESMGDEIDGALPLAEAEPLQPMESADTVSNVTFDDIKDELDLTLPLAETESDQPMELHDTVKL